MIQTPSFIEGFPVSGPVTPPRKDEIFIAHDLTLGINLVQRALKELERSNFDFRIGFCLTFSAFLGFGGGCGWATLAVMGRHADVIHCLSVLDGAGKLQSHLFQSGVRWQLLPPNLTLVTYDTDIQW